MCTRFVSEGLEVRGPFLYKDETLFLHKHHILFVYTKNMLFLHKKSRIFVFKDNMFFVLLHVLALDNNWKFVYILMFLIIPMAPI